MHKVYLAGKITGDENYKKKFADAEEMLHRLGYTVLSPAILPEGMTGADYMRICFPMIDTADTVVFLSDYQESPGAMVEYKYCAYIGKPMMLYKEILQRRKVGGDA